MFLNSSKNLAQNEHNERNFQEILKNIFLCPIKPSLLRIIYYQKIINYNGMCYFEARFDESVDRSNSLDYMIYENF